MVNFNAILLQNLLILQIVGAQTMRRHSVKVQIIRALSIGTQSIEAQNMGRALSGQTPCYACEAISSCTC